MIETLIDKLVDLNVRVELVDGDKLKVHAGINKIPGELLEELKQNKEGLIKYLKEQQSETGFEAIQLTETAESYQSTPAQKSIWLISQFEEANIAYNMPGAFVFEGELDYDSLSYAFGKIIERYEVLRTVFREDKTGEVRMYINKPGETGFLIRQRDYRAAADPEQLIRHTVKEEFTRPFDLANGPLVRADLCRTEENTWVFILVMHHIVSDGWSMDLLLNELLSLYNARAKGEDLQLNPLRIQFKDFAAWQNKQLQGGAIEEHRNYWLKQFDGTLPVLELPADKERPNVKTYNGDKWSKQLNADLSEALKKLAYENDATLFMSLLALVNALFYRCTKQEDIVIGTPVAGREHVDTLDQAGYFINTLALRTQFNGTDSFKELLSKVKQVVLGAFKYQAYPFDELVTGLNLQRDISRNPLFDAQVVLQNSAMTRKGKEHYFHKLKVSEYEEIVYSTSVFFTVFSFTETTDGLRVDMMYNSDIYSEQWMQRLGDLLEALLASVIHSPATPVNRLPLLDETHLHTVVQEFNNTATTFKQGNTVIEIFREQVQRRPGAAAVVNGTVTLTYKELDKQSDLLASILLSKYSIRPGQCIGVMLERSDKTIIAVLGILKAGAIYVPVDPEYPLARKEYIIKDTGLQLLVTQTEFLFDLQSYEGVSFAIDIQLTGTNIPEQNSLPGLIPEQTAYIIYTSGSTGEPKGVVIQHSALANSILAQQEVMALAPEDRSLQFFPVSFDVSIFEIFIALLSGASLYIIPDYEKKDPLQLAAFIRENEITVATLPAVYLQLTGLENTPTLKKLITGGEQADSKKVYAFSERGTYYNAYGPTESAICVALFKIENGTQEYLHTIPVGKPLANIQLYITDEFMSPVPIGITGEIYIGGAGLAKEYLNNPQMTAEKFVKSPFKEGERLYKTGDLGRWKADGNIEFIGRKDDQVKIRGHRIELGEIQTALQGCTEVNACVVTAVPGQNGESELVAYITADQPCSAATLRAYLSNIIPVYMLPAVFIQLEELPLTTNGKVDKSKLPAPAEANLLADTTYVEPQNETEEKIAAIWKEMLGRERVGITDDYFEIGGNSLKAMSIIKRMIEETGISVPLKILFEEKTIENILKSVTGNNGADQPSFIRTDEPGSDLLPLAWNQQLYFSSLKPVHETVQAVYEVEQLDMKAFRLTVQELVNRHEVLRTIYVEQAGTIQQKILSPEDALITINEPYAVASPEEMKRMTSNEQPVKFELHRFPLFSVDVHKIDGGNYHVRFIMHHIITDGYSNGIIMDELTLLYASIAGNSTIEMQTPVYQYRHFVNWQQDFLSSAQGEKQKQYWLKKLEGMQAPAGLYTRKKSADYSSGKGICITQTISGNIYQTLTDFCRENGLTKTSFLLAMLHWSVCKWFEQDDIVITSTVSGRNSKYYGKMDAERLTGFLANTLFIRNTFHSGKTVAGFLKEFQQNFLDDLENQEYPFMKLIDEIPGISPENFLADSVFYNYHNYSYKSSAEYDITGKDNRKITPADPQEATCGLAVTEYKNCLELQFIFRLSRFDTASATEFGGLFFDLLNQSLENPGAIAGSINAGKERLTGTPLSLQA